MVKMTMALAGCHSRDPIREICQTFKPKATLELELVPRAGSFWLGSSRFFFGYSWLESLRKISTEFKKLIVNTA